ncbi:PucR family transcriptional regulator [Sporomusa termitida]|nr:helix-turn-helix domain-containing protein [Sporomusa termitida]
MLFDTIPQEQINLLTAELSLAVASQSPRGFRYTTQDNLTLLHHIVPMDYQVNGKKTVAVILIDITAQEDARQMLQTAYELQRRSELLNEIFYEPQSINEEKLAYAANLGLSFTGTLFCCAITIDFADRAHHFNNKDFAIIQEIKTKLLTDLYPLKGCTLWHHRNELGVLCILSELDPRYNRDNNELAQYIKDRIHFHYTDLIVNIGIGSCQQGIDGFKKSFQQALEASFAAKALRGRSGQIAHYANLGILQLYLERGTRLRTTDFIQTTLGKLIDYDAQKGTDYLITLETILRSSSLKQAASVLFLHYNTIVFRKRRIEKLLQISFDDYETRLALSTAIKLHKLTGL